MRQVLLLLVLVCALAGGVELTADASSDSTRNEVSAVEKARAAAFVNHDIATLDKLLRDDLTYIHASGRIDDKKSLLAAIRSDELHYISWTPKQMNVRVSGDTAVVNGEYAVKVINRKASPDTLDLNIFFLTVYSHAGSGWQQIAWQSTKDVR
jgi:ketosteroid isomerase-like protein